VKVELLFFDGCPHWAVAEERLIHAMRRVGRAEPVHRVKIDSLEDAERAGFSGSPTILVDGRDPFADAHSPAGLACRVYVTEHGLAGSPTVEQLMEVLA
jgi:hypothetical protein